MRAGIACCVLALAGCLHSGTSTCDDGTVCPDGTVCVRLAEGTGDPHRCVERSQLDCAGADTHASCKDGVCYAGEDGGVCLPAGCANYLIDTGEQCDDGNNIPGDGCAADCSSNEQCGNAVVDVIEGEQCDDNDRVGHDGCASLCNAEAPHWIFTQPGPFGLWDMDGVYDPQRRRIVVFGG